MDPCLAAEALSNSLYMRILLCMKVITCLTGMTLILRNVKQNGTEWLGHSLHVNAKCIFLVHLLSAFLVAFFFCILHVLDLRRLSVSQVDPCDYRVPVIISFCIRLPCQICIYMQLLTMFLLAVERFIAVYHPRHYETVTKPYVALVLILLVTVFSIIFPLALLVPGVDLSKSYTGFTTKTPENATGFREVILFQLLPQFISLLLFHFVRCKSRKSTVRILGVRYQMQENRRVIHNLLPVFYSHAFILIFSAGGISLIPWFQVLVGLDDVTFSKALETTGWTPLYATLMPIIVHFRHSYRKRREAARALQGSKSLFISVDHLWKVESTESGKRSHGWKKEPISDSKY